MCAPTPPPAPDYVGAANAQGQATISTDVNDLMARLGSTTPQNKAAPTPMAKTILVKRWL